MPWCEAFLVWETQQKIMMGHWNPNSICINRTPYGTGLLWSHWTSQTHYGRNNQLTKDVHEVGTLSLSDRCNLCCLRILHVCDSPTLLLFKTSICRVEQKNMREYTLQSACGSERNYKNLPDQLQDMVCIL